MRSLSLGQLVLLLGALSAHAAIHERVADLPRRDYDYIVVGGGTGGNVIANRLSENPAVSVLVLEAGGTNRGQFIPTVPFYAPRMIGSKYDWGFSTVPQTGLDGRVVGYPRGFILGGSSSINFMVYHRTSADDYDRFAATTGDVGWSWNALQPYFAKNEKLVAPADNHDTKGEFDPRVHFKTGINSVSLPSFPTGSDTKVIGAAKRSKEFPFTLDWNSGVNLGIGWTPNTVGRGVRSSSATSYLADKYVARPNLSVLVNARVTKVVKTTNSLAGPVFRGVEFSQDGGATKQTFTVKKEVILSAGSVGTPTILQHSGIGDRATLQALGITTILHLPSVGKNLTEHPAGSIAWRVNSTDTFESFTMNPERAVEVEKEFNATQTGPLTATIISQLGFFRLPKDHAAFKGIKDPASGPRTPHYELVFAGGLILALPKPGENYFTIALGVVQPTSRGSIVIKSSDPFAAPNINPNLLSTNFDIVTMREALLAARRFVKSPIFKGYILDEVDAIPTDNAGIDAYIRSVTGVIFHPTGTAMMTPANAAYGVVNPNLKVKGAVGLRVVDASVFPFIPSGHTQVPVYVIAERAADLIKQGI